MKKDLEHPPINFGKTGVLIINLGTPDSTSWLDIRKYLKEFLSDRRVIEVNPIIWQIILNVFILNLRPSKTAKAYKEIWMKEENISPLLYYTKKQAEKLSISISKENLVVDYAMRYGNPSIRSKIKTLHEMGCENLVILPLYPQYSSTTTGSSFANWVKVCEEKNFTAKTFSVCCYPLNAGWIEAQASLLKIELEKCDNSEEALVLFSAHGLPKKIIKKGDPYQHQIEISAQAIADKARLSSEAWVICYQSRVGPLEWIGPSTESILEQAGREHREVVLLPIAFVSEHSETLVELDIEYKDLANQAGVKSYYRVPAVSTHSSFISGLGDLVLQSFERQQEVCSEVGTKLCNREHSFCPLIETG